MGGNIKKWHATPLNGGSKRGLHDAGMETFSSHRLQALVRETIQNSIDACMSERAPVRVDFSCFDLPVERFPEKDQFVEILIRCHESSEKQDEAKRVFNRGVSLLTRNSTIRVMRISDYNTKGLCGADAYRDGTETDTPWECLVKASGTPGQKSGTSGGSFGIGKSVGFAGSVLRTVFYSSLAKDGVKSSIGVARLVSYRDADIKDDTTGEIFFSDNSTKKTAIFDLVDFDPDAARKEAGTDIYVMGFDDEGMGNNGDETETKWQNHACDAVLKNFLVSLWRGQLVVTIGSKTISGETLPELIAELKLDNRDQRTLKSYYEMLTSDSVHIKRFKNSVSDFAFEADLNGYSFPADECELILRAGDDLKNCVLMTRKPGMTLFEDKKIEAAVSYLGIILITGNTMNEAFRMMEVPEHNAWMPGRCLTGKEDSKRARSQLRNLRNFIARKIKDAFGMGDAEQIDAFGANDFLPDENTPKEQNGKAKTSIIQTIKNVDLNMRTPTTHTMRDKKSTTVTPTAGGRDAISVNTEEKRRETGFPPSTWRKKFRNRETRRF